MSCLKIGHKTIQISLNRIYCKLTRLILTFMTNALKLAMNLFNGNQLMGNVNFFNFTLKNVHNFVYMSANHFTITAVIQFLYTGPCKPIIPLVTT